MELSAKLSAHLDTWSCCAVQCCAVPCCTLLCCTVPSGAPGAQPHHGASRCANNPPPPRGPGAAKPCDATCHAPIPGAAPGTVRRTHRHGGISPCLHCARSGDCQRSGGPLDWTFKSVGSSPAVLGAVTVNVNLGRGHNPTPSAPPPAIPTAQESTVLNNFS